jgi:hypothetical protein
VSVFAMATNGNEKDLKPTKWVIHGYIIVTKEWE